MDEDERLGILVFQHLLQMEYVRSLVGDNLSEQEISDAAEELDSKITVRVGAGLAAQ